MKALPELHASIAEYLQWARIWSANRDWARQQAHLDYVNYPWKGPLCLICEEPIGCPDSTRCGRCHRPYDPIGGMWVLGLDDGPWPSGRASEEYRGELPF